MILDLVYDSSVDSAPAGFTAALDSAVSFFESNFSDAVTITIGVGYGTINGKPLSAGALGESLTYFDAYNYAQIRSALAADAKSPDDASAVASLPLSDPTGGAYWVAQGEAKALGLSSDSGTDGYIGFADDPGIFDYDNSNGVSSGQYDFFGVVAHEVTEVMGRQLFAGETFEGSAAYQPEDLFHFAAPGVRTFVGTQPGYFSLDNGVTDIADFNSNPNGDFGDWAFSAGHDAFLAFTGSGHVNPVTESDMRVMDVIGWDRVTAPDLTVANLAVNATNVSYRVNNIGNAAAGASTTGIYLSSDSTITTADILIATVATPPLAPGGVDNESLSVVYPDTLTPGTYYLGAYADYDGQIAEHSEANNASNAVAVILGDAGSNVLTGTSGNDSMFAFGGNDTLNGGAGKDLMMGGAGDDTYFVDNAADLVAENSGEGADTVRTSLAKYTLPGNAENLTYTKPDFIGTGTIKFTGTGNASDNIITGGTASDSLSGLGGNDCLNGGAGSDTLDGGTGADSMAGGVGNDIYNVDDPSDAVIENPGEGTDTVKTSLSNYTLAANVELLTYTGAGNFTGVANALSNTVTGGAGNDWLDGGDGNDTIHSGAGTDTEIGGAGSDKLYGEDGNDSLIGGAGNDALDGGAGADSMAGGAGNDTYYVDAVADTVSENLGEGSDGVVTTLSSYTLAANFEKLTYTGTSDFTGTGNTLANALTGALGNDSLDGGDGNDSIHGGGGADTLGGGNGKDRLYGEDGNDSLSGGTGNDTIDGGLGYDLMRGDAGADSFVFTAADLGAGPALGEILDFNHAQTDKIDLSAIDAVAGGADNAFSFIGNGAFTGIAGQLHYVVNASGGVNVEGDTNGDGTADFSIAVDGISSLVSADFLL